MDPVDWRPRTFTRDQLRNMPPSEQAKQSIPLLTETRDDIDNLRDEVDAVRGVIPDDLDATLPYEPGDEDDWDAAPETIDAALDELAARVTDAEGAATTLAGRVTDLENAPAPSGGGSGVNIVTGEVASGGTHNFVLTLPAGVVAAQIGPIVVRRLTGSAAGCKLSKYNDDARTAGEDFIIGAELSEVSFTGDTVIGPHALITGGAVIRGIVWGYNVDGTSAIPFTFHNGADTGTYEIDVFYTPCANPA